MKSLFSCSIQMASSNSKDFVGPHAWTVLHSYAAAYTPDQRKTFTRFVKALGELFPCSICRQNFKKKLKILPLEPYLGNNNDLFFWTYCIHDMVNEAITATDPSNPKMSPPYDQFNSKYFHKLGETCEDCNV